MDNVIKQAQINVYAKIARGSVMVLAIYGWHAYGFVR